MRNRWLTPVFVLLFIMLVLAGCRSNRNVSVIRYPAQRTVKHLPPGQAKKVYGHQSAKAFAPGQQKKQKHAAVNQAKENKPGKGKKKN